MVVRCTSDKTLARVKTVTEQILSVALKYTLHFHNVITHTQNTR